MALSIATLNSLLQTNITTLIPTAATGISFIEFTLGIATGVINGTVGSTFTTVDTGQISNPGNGLGTGITGLNQTTLSSLIYNNCYAGWNSAGVQLLNITDGIAESVVTHFGSATLTSTHSPVWQGTGVVSFSSSSMSSTVMASGIQSATTFIGTYWASLSTYIASAIVTHVKSNGSGSVTITGTPPGSPTSGSGTGSGTIS